MNYPKNSYPQILFPCAAWDRIVLHGDLHMDATACIENTSAELKVLGMEIIPQQGGCVHTIKLCHRSGLTAHVWGEFN
jgi:hypothetical protein